MFYIVRNFIKTSAPCSTIALLMCGALFTGSAIAQQGKTSVDSPKVTIPQVEISNEFIHAKLYLPDANEGYYRATRFDWSGIIESLEYNGHSYFGQWFEKYSPTIHDAIMGPVEEFSPLGYNEAKQGETFVKIGVGALEKTADNLQPEQSTGKGGAGGYDRFNLFKIADPGKWTVEKSANQVTFVHKLEHPKYTYEYTKTIRLVKGKPELEVLHTLKNLGTGNIKTDVYNHNLFVIDSQTTGPDFTVTFPFAITLGSQKKVSETAEITGNKIGYKRNLTEGETVRLSSITGFSNDPEDFSIIIENSKTGAGVSITGDRPVSKIVFWSSPKAIAPEPYIDIEIEAGKEFNWKYTYEFYSNEAQK